MQEIEISKIIRSKRRTIALVVTHDATLVIRSPLKTPLDYLKSLVNIKRDWIRTKMREMQRKPKPKDKEFINGESFLYLGESYKLKIVDDIVGDVELKDNLLLSQEKASCARDVVKKWYKSEAEKKIKERCEWYSRLTGYKPLSIKISNAKKRWGSSGYRGTVNYNWRLIMAPMEIIDYVVVHELVHLEQRDHSRLFWDKVKSIQPDFKRRRTWLKDNGRTLSI
ncbi:MAG: M48 family metallopeptidase [Nitrospirae bacterium]|nr:M48 family metallopeptidase [Nitrospirota bacterium]